MKNVENSTKNFNLNPDLFMLILTIFWLIIPIITGKFTGIFYELFPSLEETKISNIIDSIDSIISLLLPIVLYISIKKIKIKDIIPLNSVSLKNCILIIFIALSVLQLETFVASIGDFLFKDTISKFMYEEEIKLSLLQVTITSSLVPAIIEELAFRGVILSGYKKQSLLVGVLMSSLYFGMMHGNLYQFSYTIVFGIFVAFIVKITNSIYSGMIMHFVSNFTDTIDTYIQIKINPQYVNEVEQITSISDIWHDFFRFLIVLPFLIFFIFLFIKNNKEEIKRLKDENIIIKSNPDKPKVFTGLFFVNVIIFIIISLMAQLAYNLS